MFISLLVFTAALLQPQAAAAAPQPNASSTEVLIWPGGFSPLGNNHHDNFENHSFQTSHREKSGNVELHQTKVDVLVIQSGTATLVYGGEGVGMHPTGPNEQLGTTITGGTSRHLVAGDIVHIPAGIPHQFILAPGESITYFVVKIVDPPAAK